MFDLNMIKAIYKQIPNRVSHARKKLGRPLTLSEKVLYSHLYNNKDLHNYVRGDSYVEFTPDRVAMQDATAQMALLQFICLLYTSPSPRDGLLSRMPSSA